MWAEAVYDVDVVQIPEPPPHFAVLSSKRKQAGRRNSRNEGFETNLPKAFEHTRKHDISCSILQKSSLHY